mgnify:FL=1
MIIYNKYKYFLILLIFFSTISNTFAYPNDFDGWRVLPIRSEEEFNEEKIGGASEQHPHSITRCKANPDIIYFTHDVGHIWRSSNGGETWQNMLGIGAYLIFAQSIEVDPVDCNTIFTIYDASYIENIAWSKAAITPHIGLYKSIDGGDNYEQVLSRSNR